MSSRHRWFRGARVAVVTAALALALAAFAADAALSWTVGPDGVEGPAAVDVTGFQPLTLKNTLPVGYDFTLYRVHDGVSVDRAEAGIDELEQAFDGPDAGAAVGRFLALADIVGGAIVPAGVEQVVYLDLHPGTYVFDVGEQDGPANHYLVLAVNEGPAGTAPAADLELHMKEFSFDFPDVVPAGSQMWHVQNSGSQPHFAVLFKLQPGATKDDLLAFLGSDEPSGPPPADYSGFLEAVTAGQSYYLPVDMAPGDYAAVCFVPDLATGQPHAMLGMIDEFRVE